MTVTGTRWNHVDEHESQVELDRAADALQRWVKPTERPHTLGPLPEQRAHGFGSQTTSKPLELTMAGHRRVRDDPGIEINLGGHEMSEVTRWTAAFGKSSAVRAMFPIKDPYVPAIRAVVTSSPLPAARNAGMYMPIINAWAFLDGGVHRIDSYGYGMTTLHTGWRVIGWQSLRVLCEILELVPPRPLSGEPPLGDPAELLRRFRAVDADDETLGAQADMLAEITNGDELRSVCRQLLGDNALAADRSDDELATGAWGDAGFTQGAARLLEGHLEPSAAREILQRLVPDFPTGVSPMMDSLNSAFKRRSDGVLEAQSILREAGISPQ